MLRVSTLYADTAGSTAQYYTRYLTQADGEQPGRWTGRQADQLGLHGDVATEDLQAVLEGRDPITGTQLGNPLVNRTTASGKVVRAVAGFDATFSAPKSLSVWWALTGDEQLAECHDVAVRAVIECVERYGSTTRVRSNGRRLHPDSQGLIAAVFRQTTSRLDDPQLHSHVVISAKVQTDDGRWLALDARTLKGFQRALGGLYQSVLRAELTARFGVAFGEIVKGQAEIAGVPDELLERFSKRTEQVERAMAVKLAEFWAREGRDPTPQERGAIGRQAAADTRGHKTGHGHPNLRRRWLVEAAEFGVTATSLTDDILTAATTQPTGPGRVLVADVVAEVSERRSAWHRLDVLQAICDSARPQPGIDGGRWAAALERACAMVLEQCVDLDPVHTPPRRRSDGRSVWIEPSARHHTSTEILAQEEHIISWAIDHQLDPHTPSTTVDTAGLDPMQAEAAAAIAGHDRLVLVVGPAGAGKTTMVRAAVADLSAHHRPVYGLAPTAKAARVLETQTGMKSDTVAKLLHEWARTDRPPEPPWKLPPQTTVVVDEAGMLATGDLHRLTALADEQRWRLCLIGDPHQLQAVARGGMFTELCATGRTIELDHIHRFRNDWEATASLQLRHGNPAGIDAYLTHERIRPGLLVEHLDTAAHAWAASRANSEYLAITTTTNDHVDAINHRVQTHRDDTGQLGARVRLDDERWFAVGDVITTRHNQRNLYTSCGDTVRNRDYWTINGITADQGLAVTRIDGHGSVNLPAHYVAEHVQLGYAATEPGNQSDTADGSITLVTPATTCRGLYVAVTRGRGDNQLCVVTATHEIADAIDVLEHVLTSDRADQPATRTRHDLATQVPHHPPPSPRHPIPDWFHDTYHHAHATLLHSLEQQRHDDHARAQRDRRIDELTSQLDHLEPDWQPHAHAIDTARHDLDTARARRRNATSGVDQASWLARPAARRDLAETDEHVTAAQRRLDQATSIAAPNAARRDQIRTERDRLARDARTDRVWQRTSASYLPEHETAQCYLDALDAWKKWALGHHVEPDKLSAAVLTLREADRNTIAALAEPLTRWLGERGLAPTPRGPGVWGPEVTL